MIEKTRICFVFSNCIKNISRYRVRYVIYGVILIMIITVSTAAAAVGGYYGIIVEEYKPYYAPEGWYIAEEDIAEVLSVSKNETIEAEDKYMTAMRLFTALTIIESVLTVYAAYSGADARSFEIAVTVSLGVSLKKAVLALAIEFGAFIIITSAVGIIAGYTAAFIISGNVSARGILLFLTSLAASILISSFMIYFRLRGLSPCRLLREAI